MRYVAALSIPGKLQQWPRVPRAAPAQAERCWISFHLPKILVKASGSKKMLPEKQQKKVMRFSVPLLQGFLVVRAASWG